MKIVFCLPGQIFSGDFIDCWTNLLLFAERSRIELYLRRKYTSNVFLCRNLILRDTGPNEEVNIDSRELFGGFPELLDYDYLMWIDSDMTFEPKDLRLLVDHDQPIIAGTAICGPKGRVNCGRFDEAQRTVWFNVNSIKEEPRNENGFVDVNFVGFAWVLIKRGVFESMPYPWFRPMLRFYKDKDKNGKVIQRSFFPSEDIGWCMLAKEAGWKMQVDPDVHVGHQKLVILR